VATLCFSKFAEEEPADRRRTDTELEEHSTHLNPSETFLFMGPEENISRTPIYSAHDLLCQAVGQRAGQPWN
jgi:hypothetical protein